MTKDDISDLRSLIERCEQTALELQAHRLQNEQAKRDLATFLWKLEQKGKAAE